jgi:cytosine/adenosine deaminase-related metal-dependent hydrolase
MDYVSGEILTEYGLQKGYLGFEKNKIIESGKGLSPKKPICKGLIVPTFVNAHTHIGDSFIRKKEIKLPKNVEALVAPPHGLKHRLLNEASEKEIIDGMKESLDIMKKTGTSCFCDFRENGIRGINQLKNALKNTTISSLILSRPKQLKYDKDEVELLLKNSQGIGASSISDWEYPELMKIAKHVKKRKKIFGIHASERSREDIDLILDLKPDFLVHMIYANDNDFERVNDNNVPVIICPRSNTFYGLKPNLKLLKKHKIDLLVGTDNAMLNPPNILDEISHLKTISKEFSILELLHAITYAPRKALNLDDCILASNSKAEFTVLDKKYLRALYISAY